MIHFLYNGECIIPINKRHTKNPNLLSQSNPIYQSDFTIYKNSKFSDRKHTYQKFYYPLKSFNTTDYSCHHKNFYNGQKH